MAACCCGLDTSCESCTMQCLASSCSGGVRLYRCAALAHMQQPLLWLQFKSWVPSLHISACPPLGAC